MKAATTKIIDNYGDEITIYKTPYGGTYDGIKCPLWIHDEGDMVTYYLQNNGEYIDTTDNYHCDLEGVPYALVVNANGEVASVELVPSTGYVVDGESFDSLRDALEAARSAKEMKTLKIEVDEIGTTQTLEIDDDSYEFYGVVVWEWHYDTDSCDLLRSHYFATEQERDEFLKDIIENGYYLDGTDYEYDDHDQEIHDDDMMLNDGEECDKEFFVSHNWHVTVTATA